MNSRNVSTHSRSSSCRCCHCHDCHRDCRHWYNKNMKISMFSHLLLLLSLLILLSGEVSSEQEVEGEQEQEHEQEHEHYDVQEMQQQFVQHNVPKKEQWLLDYENGLMEIFHTLDYTFPHGGNEHETLENNEDTDTDNGEVQHSQHVQQHEYRHHHHHPLTIYEDDWTTLSSEDLAWSIVSDHLLLDLHARLTSLLNEDDVKTKECKQLIAQHFAYFVQGIGQEESFPFVNSDWNLQSQCDIVRESDFYNYDHLPSGLHMGIIQNKTYQPEYNESIADQFFASSTEIILCYGILAHDSAEATIRLIESLQVHDDSNTYHSGSEGNDTPTTTYFIVHVDAKYPETQQQIQHYIDENNKKRMDDDNANKSFRRRAMNITLLQDHRRVRVNWGGFSMVNATLQILQQAHEDELQFTHFVHLASSTYPIASNQRIRNTLASFPKNANFMHIILKPIQPHSSIWNYYVECDDKLHRIYTLTPLTYKTHGSYIYTSSQWFIISYDFAMYLANPPVGSFLYYYLPYIQHVVVADEHFFGTVLLNSKTFCQYHHNWNFVHLQFDRWENERDISLRDPKKCLMKDKEHCGRSPTTITLDYLDILELSGDLFARKFTHDEEVGMPLKSVVDKLRVTEEFGLKSMNITKGNVFPPNKHTVHVDFDGHGTLFVAKHTIPAFMKQNKKKKKNKTTTEDGDDATTNSTDIIDDEEQEDEEDLIGRPLCMGLGDVQNKVKLVPCFLDWVLPTLAPDWYTGAVILDETPWHNRWQIGTCSSDGNLERLYVLIFFLLVKRSVLICRCLFIFLFCFISFIGR